ncbi:MAG: hypothetical protein ABSH20_11900 [Tepidisphaeraceae bacterium]|jgi:hypothetical protein
MNRNTKRSSACGLFLAGLWTICLLCAPATTRADPPAPRPAAGVRDYIQGIESLADADYKGAAASLNKAVQADDGNADYLLARGVANTLAESFPAAIADLQRVLRLRGHDSEASIWLAAAYCMSGDPSKGAEHFAIRSDIPANYQSMVYNNMAMVYWSTRTHGSYYDREQRQQVAVKEPVRKLFPQAARAFAERHKASGPGAEAAVMDRMKTSMVRRDWPAAIRDLISLRQSAPQDLALRQYWALALLGAGNALEARAELTHVMSVQPLWAEGYLARAQAAAIIGQSDRAMADVAFAAELGAPNAAATREIIGRVIREQPALEDQGDRFARSVQADAEFATLVDAAVALHRGTNARRLRYDEAYQDRIAALAQAIHLAPDDGSRHENAARFLYNNNAVPAVWDGPRGNPRQLRPQTREEAFQELQRGLAYADQAIKLDPRQVNAVATKGWILYTIGRAHDAEALADQAIAGNERNARALGLKARCMVDRAAAFEGQASLLRQGHTDERRETHADGSVYIVRTHYPPTPEQLAEAVELEKQAKALRQEAQGLTDRRRQVEAEVVPAMIKRGDAALAGGDVAAARRAFEQAYACQPDCQEIYPRLAEVHKRQGDAASQRVFALLAQPMRETTAAAELKEAWDHLARTAWKNAGEALDRAAAIDPVDARIEAYRSVIAVSRPAADAQAAQRSRRAALALEEARARLLGTSFLRSAGPLELLDLQDAGLWIILSTQAGNVFLADKQYDKATEIYAGNLSIEKRVAADRFYDRIPSAILPDPSIPANTIPDAPTLASLMAQSRLGTAQALLALDRVEEAKQQFRAVRACLANWPATAKDRQTMNVADAWARLGLAEAAYAARDYDAAFNLTMAGEGWAWGLPPELERRKNELTEKVFKARNQHANDQMRAEQQMTPRQIRMESLRTQIKQLEQSHDSTLAEANKPDCPEQQRLVLNRSVAEFDRLIADMKKQLAKLRTEGDPPNQDPRGSSGR